MSEGYIGDPVKRVGALPSVETIPQFYCMGQRREHIALMLFGFDVDGRVIGYLTEALLDIPEDKFRRCAGVSE